MAFTKAPNVAQYQGADWSNFKKRVPNCTPAGAQRIAMRDPSITFFFYCRDAIDLGAKGSFNQGDAVFFTGQLWYGSAPQCDAYQKDFFNVAYPSSAAIRNAGCYQPSDGRPFFDVACIFAASIHGMPNNAVLCFNEWIARTLLCTTDVRTLQDQGVTVLLTVMGDWMTSGWSCFPDPASAGNFAKLLADIVDKYGLDGIDIDDEYSIGTPNDQSLIWVTSALRSLKPDIIISKALWNDAQYFSAIWNGKTLAQQLSYGWQMGYTNTGGTSRLEPYLQYGMEKKQLGLGFFASPDDPNRTPPASVKPQTDQVRDGGYAGTMLYAITDTANTPSFVSTISQELYKQDASLKPGCWS